MIFCPQCRGVDIMELEGVDRMGPELGDRLPAVSIVIVNYQVEDRVADAIASVQSEHSVAEIIVVDNGSASPLLKTLQQKHPTVQLIESVRNLGFAAAANLGASASSADLLFFLNPDATVEPGCIDLLVSAFRTRPGIVGPAVYAAANASRDIGATMNHLGMSISLDGMKPPLYVSGCALLTSRSLFVQLGGFDDRYFLFVEDVELCWRALLAGYDVYAIPEANLFHEGGASTQGGYFTAGKRYNTSTLRISLRERNTVALMIACAPWYWLPVVLPALVVRSLAFAFAGACLGQSRLSGALLRGIGWNVAQLPASLARRRSLVRCKNGKREAARRFVHRSVLLPMLWRSGLPRITEEGVLT